MTTPQQGKDPLVRYVELRRHTDNEGDRLTPLGAADAGQAKIAADVDSADLSGVSGTPTFFINGKRHHGACDTGTLSNAVRTARARALIRPRGQPRRAS